MSRLPVLPWQQVTRALVKAGFTFDRQRGSHMVYFRTETGGTVVIPRHRVIKAGTLREILREADLTRQEFIDLLSRS